jgi:alcohol dehydrogenase (NADP+)
LWSNTDARKRLANQFDLLITTVPKAYPMQPFVNVLKQDATLVNVGAMEELQGVTGINVVYARKSIAGSMIGGIVETQEVIDYCAARNVKAEIEPIRPDEINRAYERVVNKDARYRFVIDMASLKA